MRLTLFRRIDQVLRRWWVVVIFAALAAIVSVLPALTEHTKYVGKATLIVSSPQRSPEQDQQIVVGYAIVFNDPATIDRLRATRNFPQDVTFEAKTVAASPILSIEATSNNPSAAQESATRMAEAFRDDINSAQQASTGNAIADLQRQLDEVLRRFPDEPNLGPSAMETGLREQINTLKFGKANELRNLQLQGGVTAVVPNLWMNIAMGSAAGLVLGVLTALAMAAITKRIGNSTELLEKTGVEPLVELPGPGTSNASEVREDRMLTLASFVSSHIPTKPKVIAVIDSRGSDEARHIAEDLARVLAQQEYRTVLIHAESGPQPTEQVGFNDVLRDSGLVHVLLRDSAVEKLKILPRGTLFANRYSRMTSARIAAVLDELRADVDAVVVAAPAIAATPDTQLLCAAADLTIVVVDIRSSRADDVSSVVGVLKSAGANIPGAVLIDGSRRHSSRSPIKSDPQSQRANAVVAQRGGSSDTVAPDLPQ